MFVSGEPCFQGRPIRFQILMPSPFIHTERPVTGPCCKLLARYFDSFGSSQTQRPAERRVRQSFYCSSAPESEREGIVPLYDSFVTQRAPLGSAPRQCYCVFQQQLSARGGPTSGTAQTVFFNSSEHPNPWLEGFFNSFPSAPSSARGEEDFSSIPLLSRQNLDLSLPGFDPGSDLPSFWKRGCYRLSYGVRVI